MYVFHSDEPQDPQYYYDAYGEGICVYHYVGITLEDGKLFGRMGFSIFNDEGLDRQYLYVWPLGDEFRIFRYFLKSLSKGESSDQSCPPALATVGIETLKRRMETFVRAAVKGKELFPSA